MLDLTTSEASRLIATATPRDLAKTIRALPCWSPPALEAADLLFINWSSRACARQGDREEINEIQKALTQALNQADSATTLPQTFRDRWQACSDLLEARRLELAHAAPDKLMTRRHVPEILQELYALEIRRPAQDTPKESKQGELIDRLSLPITPGRLSQLLALMEAHGLITRQRSGRDNQLALTEAGKTLAAKSAQETRAQTPPANTQRGSSFLTLEHSKAAA